MLKQINNTNWRTGESGTSVEFKPEFVAFSNSHRFYITITSVSF